MDIRPPARPRPTADLPRPVTVPLAAEPTSTPVMPVTQSSGPVESAPNTKKPKKHRFKWAIPVVAGLLLALLATGGYVWWSLQPRSGDGVDQRITIASGESLQSIAQNLKQHKLIRSALTFELYTRAVQAYPNIKAGGFVLSSKQSVPEILYKITSDEKGVYMVTIAPGLTLEELADPSIKNSLAAQGFTDQEIQAAYRASYKSPLLRDKPAGASLEGYIFPETYRMDSHQTLQDVFERTFDELYGRLQRDKLIESYAAEGLNLHQAITLASIVQMEVTDKADQKQVAQVFLTRQKIGMMLGSDVTFMYAAKIMGVEPSVSLDSPYNTRRYAGLPPGPIANVQYSALEAVARPAPGDYLFFVAGDDGTTHFSHTTEEHEAKIRAYCTTLCQ